LFQCEWTDTGPRFRRRVEMVYRADGAQNVWQTERVGHTGNVQ
ncbi:4486_t:CDS:1, partial [Paraglomus brasilianum]